MGEPSSNRIYGYSNQLSCLSVGLPGDQPPAFFREARAVSALQLDPALLLGVEDRGRGRAGDGRQLPVRRRAAREVEDETAPVMWRASSRVEGRTLEAGGRTVKYLRRSQLASLPK
jgi:hypothetical protein